MPLAVTRNYSPAITLRTNSSLAVGFLQQTEAELSSSVSSSLCVSDSVLDTGPAERGRSVSTSSTLIRHGCAGRMMFLPGNLIHGVAEVDVDAPFCLANGQSWGLNMLACAGVIRISLHNDALIIRPFPWMQDGNAARKSGVCLRVPFQRPSREARVFRLMKNTLP